MTRMNHEKVARRDLARIANAPDFYEKPMRKKYKKFDSKMPSRKKRKDGEFTEHEWMSISKVADDILRKREVSRPERAIARACDWMRRKKAEKVRAAKLKEEQDSYGTLADILGYPPYLRRGDK